MINMKKRWIVCLLVGLSISAGAQQAGMSGPMADYRNGCLKMLEAMEEKDNMTCMKPRKGSDGSR